MNPAADLILRNANVITLDGANPTATAVAIDGKRIALVGTDPDILSLKGPRTEVVDCQGKTVVPGFNVCPPSPGAPARWLCLPG